MRQSIVRSFLEKYLQEALPRLESRAAEILGRADSIVVWLVGLATAAVGFLILRGNQITEIGAAALHWGVALFVLTVASGALGRFCLFLFNSYQHQVVERGRQQLLLQRLQEQVPDSPEDLSVSEKAEVLAGTDEVDHSSREIFRWGDSDIDDLYETWIEARQEVEREGLHEIASVFAVLQGKPDKSVSEMVEGGTGVEKMGRWMRYSKVAATTFFLTSMLAFVLAVVVLGVEFLNWQELQMW